MLDVPFFPISTLPDFLAFVCISNLKTLDSLGFSARPMLDVPILLISILPDFLGFFCISNLKTLDFLGVFCMSNLKMLDLFGFCCIMSNLIVLDFPLFCHLQTAGFPRVFLQDAVY